MNIDLLIMEDFVFAYMENRYRYVLWIVTFFYIYFGVFKFVIDFFIGLITGKFPGSMLIYPWVIKNSKSPIFMQNLILISIYTLNLYAIIFLFSRQLH